MNEKYKEYATAKASTAGISGLGNLSTMNRAEVAAEQYAQDTPHDEGRLTIADRLEAIRMDLSRHAELISELNQKLDPVMCRYPESNAKQPIPSPGSLVAAALYEISQHIRKSSQSLQDMISRIEL